MNIRIEALKKGDEDQLFAFECENREFFESMVPGRGEEYYEFTHFSKVLDALLKEQQEGTDYYYLIKNDINQIVGRMNLVNINSEELSAQVGYRIGEKFLGQGIASKALNLLINEGTQKKVHTFHAKTTSNNIPSQKVLEKNKFVLSQIEKDAISLNGEKADFFHYHLKN
ncbi:GNAT family N-acetyltransferase [Cytobacillus sp. FJAT-54145]|uniref:GNAT family N-acetyltransferase n=1 Tax=Cytobacillus spartinae TaxID=3299023 RepID=A0ABW6KD36_9BACI